MAGYWPSSFFSEFMDRDEVEVHKHAKKERGGNFFFPGRRGNLCRFLHVIKMLFVPIAKRAKIDSAAAKMTYYNYKETNVRLM